MSATAAATAAAKAATRTAPSPKLALVSATSHGRRGALLAALADALAGALGSVVAVAVFYPIDIAKTRAQASSTSTSCTHPNHGDYSEEHHRSRGAVRSAEEIARQSEGGRGWLKSRTLAALMSIVRNEGGLTRVYEGIEAKALQALLGSFVYFYAYAFIKGVMRRRAAAGGGGAPKSLRPSLNLLAAAMAGAVNQAFTLPLENITTRMQTAPPHPPPMMGATKHRSAKGSSHETEARDGGARARVGQGGSWSDVIRRGGGGREVVEASMVVDSRGDDGICGTVQFRDLAPATPAKTPQGEEGGDGITTTNRDNDLPPVRRRQRPRQSFAAVTGELYREGGGMARFWRGFAPSLILTCNPAINYTAFDVLKAIWLRRRDAAAASVAGAGGPRSGVAGGSGTGQRGTGGFLNPLEAFFVAAAAKSLATVITYPLIRAKVVLMTSRSSPSSLPSSSPAVDVDSYPVSTIPLQNGDDGARWGSRGSVAKTQHAVNGVRGDRDGVDGRTLVNDEVGAVVPPLTGRGKLEAGPTEPRVEPIASSVAAVEGGRDGEVEGSSTRGMGTVLMEIFRREGFGGLYAGCGAQLLHTILKSALLLAIKEQIARAAASAVFFGGNRSGAAGSARPRPAPG